MVYKDLVLWILAAATVFGVIATGASLWAKGGKPLDILKGIAVMSGFGCVIGLLMAVSMLIVSRRVDAMPLLSAAAVSGSGSILLVIGALLGKLGYRPGKGSDRVASLFLLGLKAIPSKSHRD